MAYTAEQLEGFRTKDVRLHKSGFIKSHIENCGKVPSRELLDEALRLVFENSEQDLKIIKGDMPKQTELPLSREEQAF